MSIICENADVVERNTPSPATHVSWQEDPWHGEHVCAVESHPKGHVPLISLIPSAPHATIVFPLHRMKAAGLHVATAPSTGPSIAPSGRGELSGAASTGTPESSPHAAKVNVEQIIEKNKPKRIRK